MTIFCKKKNYDNLKIMPNAIQINTTAIPIVECARNLGLHMGDFVIM